MSTIRHYRDLAITRAFLLITTATCCTPLEHRIVIFSFGDFIRLPETKRKKSIISMYKILYKVLSKN